MENEKKNLIEVIKKTKYTIPVLIGIVMIALICIMIFAPSGKTTFDVKTALKEITETAELSTAEYTYNSIATIAVDPKKPAVDKNIKCHAMYKGTVRSGFDFDKIEIVENNNDILFIIPKIKIKSTYVDEDIDCIFTKKKYDTENGYAEIYNLCCEDLKKKAGSNQTLHSTAVEGAIETLKGLTKPFESQLPSERTIKVIYIDDYKEEAK